MWCSNPASEGGESLDCHLSRCFGILSVFNKEKIRLFVRYKVVFLFFFFFYFKNSFAGVMFALSPGCCILGSAAQKVKR